MTVARDEYSEHPELLSVTLSLLGAAPLVAKLKTGLGLLQP